MKKEYSIGIQPEKFEIKVEADSEEDAIEMAGYIYHHLKKKENIIDFGKCLFISFNGGPLPVKTRNFPKPLEKLVKPSDEILECLNIGVLEKDYEYYRNKISNLEKQVEYYKSLNDL